MHALFLLQVFCTAFMTGLIWFVQVVHYPLFARVGPAEFGQYHHAHTFWTGTVVIAPMVIEALISVALLWQRPDYMSATIAWLGFGAVGLIWLSTGLLQIPRHDVLSQGYDTGVIHTLVLSNWVRTVAWSFRSGLCFFCLWKAL